MKKVFFIRHAKSSWAVPGQPDFTRPLNDRGAQDAPEMAKRLIAKEPQIDLFLSSPATRATQTCAHFSKIYQRDISLNKYDDRLYHAAQDIFYQVLSEISDTVNSIAIFSHNPGITEVVNSLETGVRIDNMPTCAIYAVSTDIKTWKEFGKSQKHFLFFDFPKNR